MKFSFMVIGYVAERKALLHFHLDLSTEHTQRLPKENCESFNASLSLTKLRREYIVSIVHLRQLDLNAESCFFKLSPCERG